MVLLASVGTAATFSVVPLTLPGLAAGRGRVSSSPIQRPRPVRSRTLAMSADGFTAPFVASIDEGTQSCRFMVFDKTGKLVAVHQEEKKQYYPQPGWYVCPALRPLGSGGHRSYAAPGRARPDAACRCRG